jgi:recombination protein RecA
LDAALIPQQNRFDSKLLGEYKANMPSAAAIRLQLESALAKRIPAAFTPVERRVRAVRPTGVPAVDALIGGFPVGAITELTGPESSGRTSLAMACLARMTRDGTACAWVDSSDTFDPIAAAATGLDLARLLWVRCGVPVSNEGRDYAFTLPDKYLVPKQIKKGLHGGGFGSHPRTETKGLSKAIGELFPRESTFAHTPVVGLEGADHPCSPVTGKAAAIRPWDRIEKALRAADLILQAGGFAALVLDLGDCAPENVARVELSVWFRYRAAVERTQSSLILLTRHPCVKSAGELLLRLHPGQALQQEATVFTGVEHRLEVLHRRFSENVVVMKKGPQSALATWKTQTDWAVRQ